MLRQLRQAAPADDRPERPRLPGRTLLPAALALVLLPAVSAAQQWLVTPEIEIAAQYVDNPRLRESGEQPGGGEPDGDGATESDDDITGGLLDLALALRRNTPTSHFVLRPSVSIFRYAGDNQEDAEEYFLDLDTGSEGQRSNWRMRGNYRQQQVYRGETTSSEIDDIGVEDDVQTGSGRTFERRQRDLFRLQPGVTFELSQRTGLDLSVNYLDVSYDTQEAGEAVDYTNGRADAALIYQVAQQSTLEFGVFAERYDPDLVQRQTDSIGARARYSLDVSDVSGFFVEVGAQESDIKGAGPAGEDLSETAFLWSLGYDRRFEVTRWRFEIGQNVTPSGSGVMVERDLLRAIMEHQFQPRWSLLLSGVVMNTDTLGGDELVTTNDRDYFQGRATLVFQATRSWSVEGLYAFTYQDFAHIEGDAQEHEVRLSLVYRPPLPTQ